MGLVFLYCLLRTSKEGSGIELQLNPVLPGGAGLFRFV